MLSIPEQAVRCFETWSRTRVTLYDLAGEFITLLGPERFVHRHTACRPAKERDHCRCVEFDVNVLRRDIWSHRDGVLKLCHAGLLEWAVPLYRRNRPVLILVAGWRRPPAGKLPFACIADGAGEAPEGDETDAAELELVMEGLRQLAARLGEWLDADEKTPPGAPPERGAFIHAYLRRHCRENPSVADLARVLHLSPSRTIHAVREATGNGFQTLLTAYRLRYAALQLQSTDLPVAAVARAAGFGDSAGFHRAFRARFGRTPLAYRRLCRETTPGTMPE